MRRDWGLTFFLLSIFTLPWIGVGTVHFLTGHDLGGGLQPSWGFLAVAILLSLFDAPRRVLRDPVLRLIGLMTMLPLLAFLLSLFGLWGTPGMESLTVSMARWARQVIQWLIMMAFVWGLVLYVRNDALWQRTLDVLFMGVLFQIVYSLWQGWSFWHPNSLYQASEVFFTSNPSILASSERLYVNNVMQDFPRLRGTACEPLYLGNFLLGTWPLLLVWQRPATWRWALAALMGGLMIMTFSRGAWLGLMGQIGALGLWWVLRKLRDKSLPVPRMTFSVVILTAGLLLVADEWVGGFLRQRLLATFNAQDWSNLTRLYSMGTAWQAFLLSPFWGIGWGQYAFHFPLLVDPMGLHSQFTWPVVNNLALRILCETGLIGVGCFLTVLVFVGRAMLAQFRQSPKPRARAVLVCVLAWGGALLQTLTFSQYNLPHLWVLPGMLLVTLNFLADGIESRT